MIKSASLRNLVLLMSCGENGYEVGRERQSRLAGTDAERDWDWMWCDGITHHPLR